MPGDIVVRELAFEPTRGKRVRATTKITVSRRPGRSKDLVAPQTKYLTLSIAISFERHDADESGEPQGPRATPTLLPTDEAPAHDFLANTRGKVHE